MLEFGNPENPFNQSGIERSSIFSDLALRCAREVIEYMSAHPEGVEVEQVGNATVRTVDLVCTAPFDKTEGVYTNETGMAYPDGRFWVRHVPTVLTLGDVVADGEVMKRWFRLTKADGGLFGVLGVSDEIDGVFEKWTALTTVVKPVRSRVEKGIWTDPVTWGEAVDGQGSISSTIVTEEEKPGQIKCFDAHYHALYISVVRRLNREGRYDDL